MFREDSVKINTFYSNLLLRRDSYRENCPVCQHLHRSSYLSHHTWTPKYQQNKCDCAPTISPILSRVEIIIIKILPWSFAARRGGKGVKLTTMSNRLGNFAKTPNVRKRYVFSVYLNTNLFYSTKWRNNNLRTLIRYSNILKALTPHCGCDKIIWKLILKKIYRLLIYRK